MENQVIIKEAQTAEDFSEAKRLILQYVNWLNEVGGPELKVTLSSQKFDIEMETIQETYGEPDGGILLAFKNGIAVGVVGIKRFNEKECEVKRMFVEPESRGLKIGSLLLDKSIELAKRLNYDTIKLDTAGFMESAIKLYTDNNFVEIPAYRLNSHPEARYFELDIRTYYHGTKANLNEGDMIGPGFSSNYGQRKQAKYVYFTATLDAATWGAELAVGEGEGRIYIVEPTGPLEDDPNLTDKKFPGNPTKSYRTQAPLRVIGEVKDWKGHDPQQLKTMRDHLERLKELGIEAIED